MGLELEALMVGVNCATGEQEGKREEERERERVQHRGTGVFDVKRGLLPLQL